MPLRHAAMLEVNEFLVLDYVRERQRSSRPEIGHALDLSPASVSRIVGRLLRSGLVVEEGRSQSDGGRPAAVVSFNRRAGAVIAIDLGATVCHGALADLAGDLLHQEILPTREHGAAFPALVATFDALTREAARQEVPVTALAVGVPAMLDPETGLGIAGPSVEWEAFEIVTSLSAHVSIPFVVENDVNLAALAHAWRGDGRQVDDFFTLYLGAGVGGAVVANGSLVKGRHNGGGEVGYLILDPADSRRPPGGSVDGVEAVISTGGLLGRARELAGPDSRRWGSADRPVPIEELFQAAADRDPIAAAVIDGLLDHVSLVLLAVGAIVDPALVVLDGPVGRALEPYVPGLAARLEQRLPRPPRLVVSSLHGDATLLGAVAAALQLARRRSAPSALFGDFSFSGVVHGVR
jgi:glucokinase